MTELIKARLTGIAPMMMHNGRLVDPLNKWTIALAEATKASNKKTAEGIALIRWLEWRGGIYEDVDDEPCIPADVVLAAALGGAKKSKQGGEAKAGIYETKPSFKLNYKGPKVLEKLYEDARFVDCRGARVGQARVMRTRPIFREWSANIELVCDTEVMDPKSVAVALAKCGALVGLGDWRPRHGRFTVEMIS